MFEEEKSMTQIRNKIIGQNACIGEQDLRDLEREYNCKFPEDIKQFYLKYNGGRLVAERIDPFWV